MAVRLSQPSSGATKQIRATALLWTLWVILISRERHSRTIFQSLMPCSLRFPQVLLSLVHPVSAQTPLLRSSRFRKQRLHPILLSHPPAHHSRSTPAKLRPTI